MIINDDTIYKRIKRLQEEEKHFDNLINKLNEVKDGIPSTSSTALYDIYQSICMNVHALKVCREEVRIKIRTLENRLTPSFWLDRPYREV